MGDNMCEICPLLVGLAEKRAIMDRKAHIRLPGHGRGLIMDKAEMEYPSVIYTGSCSP